MGRPQITVLLPVYNAGPYLAAAIESILGQSFADFELVIIDDGSNDDSGIIIARYHDARIRALANDSNRGLIATLNRGIRESSGELIARMDQDDVSRKDRLEWQHGHLLAHPGDSFCCSWYEVVQEGRPSRVVRMPATGREVKAEFLFSNTVAHSTVMMRRTALEHAGGGYDPGFRYCEDYELWLRLSREGNIGVVPEPLLKYRVLPGSESRAQPAALRENAMRLCARSLVEAGFAPSPEELRYHAALGFRDKLADIDDAPGVGRWLNRLAAHARRTRDEDLKGAVTRRGRSFLARQGIAAAACTAGAMDPGLRRRVLYAALPFILFSSLPAWMRSGLKMGVAAGRRKGRGS
jgi:glycosyltransferase involved in cell wall biosynthesis